MAESFRFLDHTVFILCGGRGSRLDSLTHETPKVLTPLHDKPILHHILENFRKQGFHKFVLGTGYLSNKVEAYVEKAFPELEIIISNSGENTSMLKRIHEAKPFFSEIVLVAYGDTFIELNHMDLLRQHVTSKCDVTLVTGQIQNPFGVVNIDSAGLIQCFIEKPVYDYYLGSFVFSKRALNPVEDLPLEMPDGAGLVTFFNDLAKAKKLAAWKHEGLQITFNTEQELINARNVFREYFTLKETPVWK